LSSSIPKQGGGYTFVQDTFGGFPGFVTGWFMFIGNIVASSLYALAVAYTIAVFVPDVTTSTIGIIAIVIILITFVTNILSFKGVTGILGVLNIAQSIVLFSFVFIGLFFIQPTNLDPLFAPGTGLPQFMGVVSFIYISFVGFELITTASEEIKDPARNIPRAIMLTLAIATAVYMAAALVIVGVVPYTDIANSTTPISDAYGAMLGVGAFYLGLAGMAASNYAALNATFLAAARVAYSMGRDRYFPAIFEKIHKRLKSPIPALVLSLILVSIFASLSDVSLAASLAGFGYLIGLSIVNLSVIMLHRKGLHVPGTFKAKFFPAIPILGVISCLMLVPSLHVETLWLGALLSLAGLIVYLLYGGRKNTRHEEILNGTAAKLSQQ